MTPEEQDVALWQRWKEILVQASAGWDGDGGGGWTAEALVAAEAIMDPRVAQARAEPGGEKRLVTERREELVHAARRGVVATEAHRGRFLLRPLSQVGAAEAAVESWRAFKHRCEDPSGALAMVWDPAGREVLDDEDRVCVELVLEAWMHRLGAGKPPAAWDLLAAVEGRAAAWQAPLRRWGRFDLDALADDLAKQRSGLQFRHATPAVAQQLLAAERVDAGSLLDLRLAALRQEGKHRFSDAWPEHLVAHADALPEVDAEAALAAGREDLRHLPFTTIDPDDAKDFDDAVAFEVLDDARRRIWVAIADVANYVHRGTSLDAAAQDRATSVYLPHRVLPMLPPRLADDLCSLRADVPRLAMVIALTVDAGSGEVLETSAHEAVIQIAENTSYGAVLPDIESGDGWLADLDALATTMRDRRARLETDRPELRPRLRHADDGSGPHVEVEIKHANAATRLIETLMVATNEAVGDLLGEAGAPLPWRVHPPPDRPDVEAQQARLDALAIDVTLPRPSHRTHGQSQDEADTAELASSLAAWAATGGASIELADGMGDLADLLAGDEPTPADADQPAVAAHLANVLDPEARDELLRAFAAAKRTAAGLSDAAARIVDAGVLQLLHRATYSAENLGHFGLGLDTYVHFTSPIRRYPDLIAHRQLKAHLRGEPWVHDVGEVEGLSDHCTAQGRAAQVLEWELVAQAYGLRLLAVPEELSKGRRARVIGLRGAHVMLDLDDDGSLVSRVHVRSISPRVRLVVDDTGTMLRVAGGERPDGATSKELARWASEQGADGGQVVLRLGQRVPVRVRGVDVWSGELDVVLDG